MSSTPSLAAACDAADTWQAFLPLLFPDERFPRKPRPMRKLRLVVCGAARIVWPLLHDARFRTAVETAERDADGLIDTADMRGAAHAARDALAEMNSEWATSQLHTEAERAAGRFAYSRYDEFLRLYQAGELAVAAAVFPLSVFLFTRPSGPETGATIEVMARFAEFGQYINPVRYVTVPGERYTRVMGGCPSYAFWVGERPIDPLPEVFREVYGSPFQPARLKRKCLTPTVVALADAITADGAFDRLPVLADALEEAGCTDAAILDHARGPGPHVRGCWVVDLVRGKHWQPKPRK